MLHDRPVLVELFDNSIDKVIENGFSLLEIVFCQITKSALEVLFAGRNLLSLSSISFFDWSISFLENAPRKLFRRAALYFLTSNLAWNKQLAYEPEIQDMVSRRALWRLNHALTACCLQLYSSEFKVNRTFGNRSYSNSTAMHSSDRRTVAAKDSKRTCSILQTKHNAFEAEEYHFASLLTRTVTWEWGVR